MRHSLWVNVVVSRSEQIVPDIVFVHIPKTGGTSLRTFLRANLPEHRAVFDYGPNTNVTHKRLLEKYAHKEQIDVRTIFEPGKALFVSGHFAAAKYLDQFSPMSFVSVIREPFERIVSLHNHLSRKNGHAKDFSEFIREKNNINLQYRILRELNLHHSGLIFSMGNYNYGTQILQSYLKFRAGPPPHQNKGDYGKTFKEEVERFRKEFMEMNERDYELFNEVDSQRAVGRLARESKTVGAVRGAARIRSEHIIVGWLVSRCGKAPLTFDVLIKGEKVGEGLADVFRPDLRARGITPHGVCGIHFEYGNANLLGLRTGDIVIRETGGSNFELSPKARSDQGAHSVMLGSRISDVPIRRANRL
jgi:hypothetical protein